MKRLGLHNLFLIFLFVTGPSLFSLSALKAQETDYKAYTLFIYNFVKYIEWPDTYHKGEFVIGVLGESAIYNELKTLAATKKVNGKSIIIRKYSVSDSVSGCHLVFVSSSKSSSVKSLNERTKNQPVLIVAEREGLARKGAAINFVTLEDEILRFEVNKKAIEGHQLKIQNELLKLGFPVGYQILFQTLVLWKC